MKNLASGMFMAALMASAISMSAQTPGDTTSDRAPAADMATSAPEIVATCVAAIGGKDAISKVKSVYTESSIAVNGANNPSTTMLVDGVGFKSEMTFNGKKIIQCYNDKGGWSIDPTAGAPDPTPMPDDVYNAGKAQIYVGGGLVDYEAKGGTIESMGGKSGPTQIKLTSKENVESVFTIDRATNLVTTILTKGKMQGQDVDITTRLSDYRKIDFGYVIPYKIDVDFGGQSTLTVTVKKVELNKTIDPAVFEIPGKS
jgi:hypothetical protein